MKMNRWKLGFQYSILQGSYWAALCAVCSFATVFLLAKGFDSARIGVLIAAGNLMGVLLQPYFASAADGGKSIGLHRMTASLGVLAAAALALQCLGPQSGLMVASLFFLSNTLIQILQPLVNSVSVYYVNRGAEVDFGVARSVGSVAYATVSWALGLLAACFESIVIPGLGLALMAVFVFTMRSMPVLEGTADQTARARSADAGRTGGNRGILQFFAEYKSFTVTLLGITLIFTFHNMTNSYMIQIVQQLGGGSSQMGTALSIAAVLELPMMVAFAKLVRRFSSGRLLMVSGVVFVLKALGFLLAGNIVALYLVQILQMGSFALYVPASVYYVNETMSERDKFKGQAVMTGTNTLGGVLGSLMGGFLLEIGDVRLMLASGFLLAVSGCALVCLSTRAKDSA